MPYMEPDKRKDKHGDAKWIADRFRHAESLVGNEEERRAHCGHEQCWYERDDIGLAFDGEINSHGP